MVGPKDDDNNNNNIATATGICTGILPVPGNTSEQIIKFPISPIIQR